MSTVLAIVFFATIWFELATEERPTFAGAMLTLWLLLVAVGHFQDAWR